MSAILMIGVIAIIVIVALNMGKGTKAEDGDFVLRAIAGDNDVALVLEKIKSEQKGKVIIPKGVTTIGYDVFKGMIYITDVTIHEKVKIIGQRSFKDCLGLDFLYTGEGTERIGDESFEGCLNLKVITIGPRTKNIDPNAFKNCPNIAKINIECLTPPDIFENCFDEDVKKNCILYVPKGRLEIYSRAIGWSKFNNIQENE